MSYQCLQVSPFVRHVSEVKVIEDWCASTVCSTASVSDADDLNANRSHFMGGLRVVMPSPDQVLRASLSRMPRVKEGATLPVLFQWPGAATDVKLLLCEMSAPLAERAASTKSPLR